MNRQPSKSEADKNTQVIVSVADPPILLNVEQVARMLGVGTSYVWDRIMPKLPVIREGRRVLVHRADVIAYARDAREAARSGRASSHVAGADTVRGHANGRIDNQRKGQDS